MILIEPFAAESFVGEERDFFGVFTHAVESGLEFFAAQLLGRRDRNCSGRLTLELLGQREFEDLLWGFAGMAAVGVGVAATAICEAASQRASPPVLRTCPIILRKLKLDLRAGRASARALAGRLVVYVTCCRRVRRV